MGGACVYLGGAFGFLQNGFLFGRGLRVYLGGAWATNGRIRVPRGRHGGAKGVQEGSQNRHFWATVVTKMLLKLVLETTLNLN